MFPDISSQRTERPYFVWMSTTLGPQAQKWATLQYGERNRLKPDILASYALSDDEAALSIDELSRRYPLVNSISER